MGDPILLEQNMFQNSTIEDDIATLVQNINDRRNSIRKYQNYYIGKTKVTFMGARLQADFGKKLENLSVNRCQPVIDLTLDRISIEGFDADGETTIEKAEELWEELDLDQISEQVHSDALISGDGWLLIWPEGDDIRIAAQEPEQISVLWDREFPDQIEVGAKTWQRADGTWRLNLYYRDRLEKYVSTGKGDAPPANSGAWEQWQDDEDHSWPVQHSLGVVPLFHFAVKTRSGAYGMSDLTPIIPLQERLNQSLANQAVAEEFQSYKQRWATGLQIVKDEETGEAINPFQEGADKLWIATSPDSRFGEFSSTDLGMFEDVLDGHEARIARTARIPQHFLLQGGTPDSGESLKTAEAPFVSKVKARQRKFSITWNQVMRFLLELRNINDARVKVRWASAETRDETNIINQQVLKVTSLGVSKKQAQRELGYSNSKMETFEEENAEDARTKQRFFDEGYIE